MDTDGLGPAGEDAAGPTQSGYEARYKTYLNKVSASFLRSQTQSTKSAVPCLLLVQNPLRH